MSHKYIFKTILVGDSGVGKSSMLLRFTDNRFNTSHDLTIGVEFGSIVVNVFDGTSIKITIWDTAGQESFRSITRSYYRDAAGVLLCFDITNRVSFANVHTWIDDVRKYSCDLTRIVLVGTKTDLDSKRVITSDEAQQLANEYGISYIEVSSKSANSVSGVKYSNEAFKLLVQEIYDNMDNSPSSNTINGYQRGIKLSENEHINQNNKVNGNSCC
jgi:Ras-related protein Rab-2A